MGMMGIVWRSMVLWMLLVCEAEGGRARRAAVALTSQSSSLFSNSMVLRGGSHIMCIYVWQRRE